MNLECRSLNSKKGDIEKWAVQAFKQQCERSENLHCISKKEKEHEKIKK